MDKNLMTLINALEVATKRGAFELKEIPTIIEAIGALTSAPVNQMEVVEDKPDENKKSK